MYLRVYEMVNEAERKRIDRDAERGWQVEQAAALQAQRSPSFARRIVTMLGTALGFVSPSGQSSVSTRPVQTAPSPGATLGQEVSRSRTSRQQPACAIGD